MLDKPDVAPQQQLAWRLFNLLSKQRHFNGRVPLRIQPTDMRAVLGCLPIDGDETLELMELFAQLDTVWMDWGIDQVKSSDGNTTTSD